MHMEHTHRSVESNIFSTTDERKSSCSIKTTKDRQNRQLKKIYAKNQSIQECLSTLDIFKSLMDDADEMKNKIVRDVAKSIFISSFEDGDVIYNVQDQSNQIFLVFQGVVSLKIRKRVQPEGQVQIIQQNQVKDQFIYEEVETFQKGEGFGEAEFIRGRTRDFQACVKTKGSIIGRLHIESFEEVIENYKMRVYYKKLEMFKKCPLLSEISGNRLEFIVNSSKPLLLGMSKTLIRQGEYPKSLYLVSKGQLQFVKNNSRNSQDVNELSNWKSKKVSRYFVNPFESKQKLQIRKINEGAFIGDVQIALNQPFGYQIIAASEKVYLYACDLRLILSQIPPEELENSKLFYQHKLLLHNHQLTEIKQTRKIATENSKLSTSVLTLEQINIKKQIRKRYLNTTPFSLVDESSPQEIFKMLQRKRSRIKTEEARESFKTVPVLQLFEKKYPLKKKKYQKLPLDQSQTIQRTLSIEYSCVSLSPPKRDQKHMIKSYREMMRFNSDQKQEKMYCKQVKEIKKRKVSLPPIISIAMLKKRFPEKKKFQQQKKYQILPHLQEEQIIGNRMGEFIEKIQLIKQTQE